MIVLLKSMDEMFGMGRAFKTNFPCFSFCSCDLIALKKRNGQFIKNEASFMQQPQQMECFQTENLVALK